jgi:nucleoid DNA-binding protein
LQCSINEKRIRKENERIGMIKRKNRKYLTYTEIINKVSHNIKAPLYLVHNIADELQFVLLEGLVEGGKSSLKIGRFYIKTHKARKRMNVVKNIVIDIPSKKHIKFSMCPAIRRIIDGESNVKSISSEQCVGGDKISNLRKKYDDIEEFPG